MDPEQIPIRDLHLPDAVGLWPLAPGWWVLLALAVAGLVYLLYRGYRRWRWNAARRAALRQLSRIRAAYVAGTDAVTLAVDLSELLRRTMLAYAPRNEVASLTGRHWLEWLDRGLTERPFAQGAGRAIESLPYLSRSQVADDVDLDGLIRAVQQRLRTPLPEGAG
jgi:hypothetical protein